MTCMCDQLLTRTFNTIDGSNFAQTEYLSSPFFLSQPREGKKRCDRHY